MVRKHKNNILLLLLRYETIIFEEVNKKTMDKNIQQKIDNWLSGNYEQSVKDAITTMQKDNPDELADAFYKNLEFGTGGLRGLMGIGTNRMNKYTVGMATQGYAN